MIENFHYKDKLGGTAPQGLWDYEAVVLGQVCGKDSACQGRRHKFDPWVRKIPGEENGNPVQYSCLGNSMEKEPGRLQSSGVAEELDKT